MIPDELCFFVEAEPVKSNSCDDSEESGPFEDRDMTNEEFEEWIVKPYMFGPLDNSCSEDDSDRSAESVSKTETNRANNQNEQQDDRSNNAVVTQEEQFVVSEAERARVIAEQNEIFAAIKRDIIKKSTAQEVENKKQTTMNVHFPVRSALKGMNYAVGTSRTKQIEKKKELEFLKSVKTPFAYDDEISTSEVLQKWHRENFQRFLDDNDSKKKYDSKDEDKIAIKKSKTSPGGGKLLKRYPQDTKNEVVLACKKCCNPMKYCHDFLFGSYCRDTVKRYYLEHPAVAEEIVAKKIFIDSYNQYREIDIHKRTGRLIEKEQLYPPPCVIENSFNFVIDWLNYKKNKRYINKDPKHPSTPRFSLSELDKF